MFRRSHYCLTPGDQHGGSHGSSWIVRGRLTGDAGQRGGDGSMVSPCSRNSKTSGGESRKLVCGARACFLLVTTCGCSWLGDEISRVYRCVHQKENAQVVIFIQGLRPVNTCTVALPEGHNNLSKLGRVNNASPVRSDTEEYSDRLGVRRRVEEQGEVRRINKVKPPK